MNVTSRNSIAVGCILVLLLPLSVSLDFIPLDRRLSSASKYPIPDSQDTRATPPTGFSPIGLIMVGRHGTRLPTKGCVKTASKLSDVLRLLYRLLSPDLQTQYVFFNKWTSPYELSTAGNLLPAGEKTWRDIADRLMQEYSFLKWNTTKSTQNPFHLFSSDSARAIGSAVAFGKQLFQQNSSDILVTQNNILLHFNDLCERFRVKISENDKVSKVMSTAMSSLAAPIATELLSKLGLADSVSRSIVTSEFIIDLYKVGMYNLACYGDASFVSLLDSLSVKSPQGDINAVDILNYGTDVEHYSEFGTCTEKCTSKTMACYLLARVLADINTIVSSNNILSSAINPSMFYFAHYETVIPLMSLMQLQLTQDDPKLAPSSPEFVTLDDVLSKKDRVWKDSNIGPFSTNLQFTVYSQPMVGSTSNFNYYVALRHNERDIPFPLYSSTNIYCPLDIFLSLLSPKSCDESTWKQGVCSVDPASTASESSSSFITLVTFTIIIVITLCLFLAFFIHKGGRVRGNVEVEETSMMLDVTVSEK